MLPRNSNFLLIVFLLFLTLFLAFYRAEASLWLDEAYSVLVAKQSFSELLVSLENDAHPPLYYLLLGFWMKIFGDSEIAARSLSGVFYLGGVVVIYLLGREIYEKRIGLLAAFLYALSPLATGTAHSVRMYALLGFLSALSTLLFAKIFLRNNSSRLVFCLLIAVNALGTFTQIWFFFLLASQFFTYLILFYPQNRLKFLALQVFSVLPFAILWVPILLMQLKVNATAWMGRPGLAEITAVLLGFFGERIAVIFYLLLAVLLFLSSRIWSKEKRGEAAQSFKEYFRLKSTLIFILLFTLSILIPFLVGQFKPIFGQTRFTIIALPAFAVMLASLLYKFINLKALTVFCVFLCGLVTFAFVKFHNRPQPCSDRNVTAQLLEKAADGDALLFTSSSRTTTDYYLNRFGRSDDFVKYTFPQELDRHPGWRNEPKMLERRAELESEANDLMTKINDLRAAKPRRIWLFYGLDREVSDILKRRLDTNFTMRDKIDAACSDENGKHSDTYYEEILQYTAQ